MNLKKEYMTPKMSILDFKLQAALLSCSGDCDDIDDFKESNDEFGLNLNAGTDRKA